MSNMEFKQIGNSIRFTFEDFSTPPEIAAQEIATRETAERVEKALENEIPEIMVEDVQELLEDAVAELESYSENDILYELRIRGIGYKESNSTGVEYAYLGGIVDIEVFTDEVNEIII